MYRKQIFQKVAPPLPSTAISKEIASSPSYGSLSSVVQRVQQDPNSVSGDERQELESAIGSRSTREILVGKQTSWVPEFQGISAQLWDDAGQGGAPIQAKGNDDVGVSEVQSENQTGLPNELKAGVENLSGYSLDDVRVHYNSPKPAQLQALAYTQGTEIHVAPGQEEHLPHEAWHVVQQMQGRVKPTMQMKGVQINDDGRLEKEADIQGKKSQKIQDSISYSWALPEKGAMLLQKKANNQEKEGNQYINPTGVNDVIQLVSYKDVEKQAKNNQTISQTDIEQVTKDFLVELVRDLGYLDADGNPVGIQEMQNVNFMWDGDYGAITGLIMLPDITSVVADIKNGVFQMALRHEIGHYIRSSTNQPVSDNFQDIEDMLNNIDWNDLKTKYPNGDMNNWKEEVRADLKSIVLEYRKERSFPSKAKLAAFETMLGPVVDNAHPPAAFRVKAMQDFIKIVKPSCCCYLTTACVQLKGLPDDCEELTLLRQFRDNYLLKKPNGRNLVNLYYNYSPKIVEKIDQDLNKEIIYEYIYEVVRDCVNAIKRQDMDYTYLKYCEMVIKLKEYFLQEDRIPDYVI